MQEPMFILCSFTKAIVESLFSNFQKNNNIVI